MTCPAHSATTPNRFHPPHAPYLATWQRFAGEHANLRLVLSGHNHVRSNHDHGSFISTTSAAFGEIPAQLRLVTIGPRSIDVRTIRLAAALDLAVDLDPPRAWAVGSPETHGLSIPIAATGPRTA
jgi:hypothetical protein